MSFLAAFVQRQLFYEPPAPTASFQGQTVIVTGSNGGLGLEASRQIVQLGASKVILACRSIEKGRTAAKDIQESTSCAPDTLDVWQLDMGSYASVQAFADKAKSELARLDVLILNAGIRNAEFRMAEDDEETITVNVVSLALLGFLLHPKLHETAAKYGKNTHLTVTGSELYEMAKFKERGSPEGELFAALRDESKASMFDRYNVSKLLGIFIIKKMAALAPLADSSVIVNIIAPGYVLRSSKLVLSILICYVDSARAGLLEIPTAGWRFVCLPKVLLGPLKSALEHLCTEHARPRNLMASMFPTIK
jgi:NAD(P)-dependent dehydrogenase (short-subunit alcohol dehydrogenase family)